MLNLINFLDCKILKKDSTIVFQNPPLTKSFSSLRLLNNKEDNYQDISPLKIDFLSSKPSKNSDVSFNDLEPNEFKNSAFSPNNLATLSFDSNQLDSLPNGVDKFNLEVVNLNNNRFTHFPSELLKMKNLKSIYLANNHISTLPDNISDLSNLEILILTGNEITCISENFKQLPQNCKVSFDEELLSEEVKHFLSNIKDGPQIYLYSKNLKIHF